MSDKDKIILEIAKRNLLVLKQAYRKLMKIHHPDAGGDPEEAKRIIAAYTILNDRLSK